MNQGKRYLRNTVFVIWGTAIAFIGANRINLAGNGTLVEGKPKLTFGLRYDEDSAPPRQAELATVRDFTQLSVHGRFHVEVVGGPEYKVTYSPAAGNTVQPRSYVKDGVLTVVGNDEGAIAEGELRVEVPSLERINMGVPDLSVTGLRADSLSLYGARGDGILRLQENTVREWKLFSGPRLEVRVDAATLAAGTIESRGYVLISAGD